MRPLATLVLLTTLGMCLAQEAGKEPAKLTLEDVLDLVHARVAEDVVITRIKRYNRPFDLNSDEIRELKKRGVSDTVISYLLEPSRPYTPPPPPAPKPAAVPLKDPLMVRVPPDPGLYWLSNSEPGAEKFEYIELKPIVPLKSGGGKMSKVFPLKGSHTLGFLVPSASRNRVSPGANAFYARLGANVSTDDIVLLKMAKGDGRRTLDFGPKPGQPVFPPDAMRAFDSTPLAEGLYRLNVESVQPGEYIFLIRGSGDEKKGFLGKGYDFGSGPQ